MKQEIHRHGSGKGDSAAEPLTTGADGAATIAGVSRAHWYRLVATRQAPQGFWLGKRRVWLLEELRAWLAAGAPALGKWNELRREGA